MEGAVPKSAFLLTAQRQVCHKWHGVANDVGTKHTSVSRSHILFMDVVFNGRTKSSSFRQSF